MSFLDFRDLDSYKKDVENFKPDYLFHLGAYTDLEFCEENIDDTYATNTLAVENAVFLANQLNIPLLYISTAGIFDGKQKLYDDWDMPNPLGVYARSKYMGERFVCENAKRSISVTLLLISIEHNELLRNAPVLIIVISPDTSK